MDDSNSIIPDDLTRYIVKAGAHHLGLGGWQITCRFPNEYGASIVCFPYSYGADQKKAELAVIRWEGDKFDIDYSTPIADDVMGYLSPGDVRNLLHQIMALPPHQNFIDNKQQGDAQ